MIGRNHFDKIEKFYDKDIERYYDSLQMGLNHNYHSGRNDADLTQWITYFIEVMVDVFERVSKDVKVLYNQQKVDNSSLEQQPDSGTIGGYETI